ncbi:uncharacterized protein LOC105695430 [Orussus abietinus]|uniref:uncharacterized protein LOC105695430 n=1 Tax=Orussus abietinus TaxID=222816 RepID=UPI0006265B78|nr:uncharacterized protein LOC105695430 [Orussus abietinus]
MRHTLRIFVAILALHRPSRGLECYQCNSKENERCTAGKVDPSYLRSCPESRPFCRKVDSKYYFMDSPERFVSRECSRSVDADEGCYVGRYTYDSYQEICECGSPGCNRASSPRGGSFPLLQLAFARFLLLDLV